MSDYRYDPRKGFIPLEVEKQVTKVSDPSFQQAFPQVTTEEDIEKIEVEVERQKPKNQGLLATPQVQEGEGAMLDMGAIADYLKSFLHYRSPTEKVEPSGRTGPEKDVVPTSELSNDFINIIKEYEGKPILKARKPVKGDPYTIGYGRTRDLEGNPITKDTVITEEEADQMLREDLVSRMKEIRRAYPDFNNYPKELQLQITQSYYRGTLTPEHSPKTRELINQGKFKEAAEEFLDHKEYKNAKELGRPGIRKRMDDVALALRKMGEVTQAASGGRLAKNPNPYEPRVI